MAHLTASIGLLEALQLLEQYGADFELHTSKGIKPIHDAAANGQTGMNYPYFCYENNLYVILINLDVLEYLALIGCDIFAQTSDGSTILHYSSAQGHTTCVEMILGSNFDPNVVLITEEVCRVSWKKLFKICICSYHTFNYLFCYFKSALVYI